MDLALFIRNRLKQLRLGQRDYARATRMTESYISHMVAPTAANRSTMSDQLERVLRLSQGDLARLADLQRREYLKKRLEDQPSALLHRRVGINSLYDTETSTDRSARC